MSLPSSSDAGPGRKPQPDIYTILLAVALVALLVACILLYLEQGDYRGSAMLVSPTSRAGAAMDARVAASADGLHKGRAAVRSQVLGFQSRVLSAAHFLSDRQDPVKLRLTGRGIWVT